MVDRTLGAMVKEDKRARTDMVLHAGDMSYANGEPSIWDEFMTAIEPIASRIPYMVGPWERYHADQDAGGQDVAVGFCLRWAVRSTAVQSCQGTKFVGQGVGFRVMTFKKKSMVQTGDPGLLQLWKAQAAVADPNPDVFVCVQVAVGNHEYSPYVGPNTNDLSGGPRNVEAIKPCHCALNLANRHQPQSAIATANHRATSTGAALNSRVLSFVHARP